MTNPLDNGLTHPARIPHVANDPMVTTYARRFPLHHEELDLRSPGSHLASSFSRSAVAAAPEENQRTGRPDARPASTTSLDGLDPPVPGLHQWRPEAGEHPTATDAPTSGTVARKPLR